MRSPALLFALGIALHQPTAAPAADSAEYPDWAATARLGLVEVAAGKGEKGPWQQNDSRYDYVDDPTPAIDSRGRVLVAWVDQGRKDIFLQRFSPDGEAGFIRPVNVSRSPRTFSWLPRIALGPGDGGPVFLLWQEIIFSGGSHGGDIFFARSLDGGATFSEPINLSRSRGGDGKGRITREIWHNGSLDLAVGKDGTLYAAWTEYDGALWFTRSTDGGGSFALPRAAIPLNPTRPARAPSLAVGPDGSLYLAWTTGENEGADIQVARSTDGGASFAPPVAVAPSESYSDAPKLAVDGAGTVHLAYAESSGGPFEQYRVRYTRSADGGRSFATPRDISSPPPEPFTSAGFPALSLDGQGNPHVLWELFRTRPGRSAAQGMAVSPDGGRTFSRPILLPGSIAPAEGSNGSQQGLLMDKLAVDESGALAVANSSLVPGGASRVWIMQGKLGPLPK